MKLLATTSGLALALAGCSSGEARDDAGTTPATTGTTPATTATTGPTTTTTPTTGATDGDDTSTGTPPTTSTSGPIFDLGGTPDLPGEKRCSADLHAVVDGLGQVVEQCASHLGCADATCIPACDAAAATRASAGCDFQLATPPTSPFLPDPPCFAAFLTNSWGHPAKLEVSRAGVSYDLATFARIVTPGLAPADWPPVPADGIAPGDVAVLFLSSHPTAIHPETMKSLKCPVPDAVGAATQVNASGRGAAFHIRGDIPLTAYDMAPFGGAFSYLPSAELLFPTSAWGTNYVAILPPAGTYDPPGPLWLQIVGQVDGTTVEIQPTGELLAGPDLEGALAGISKSFTVNAGEVLQWQLAPGTADGSGTLVLSDQPVALHSGNRFLRLQPVPAPGGEATHQQSSPVSALGQEYVAAPYETRRADLMPEDVDYRFVGAVDGTQLSYDPPMPGAPTTLTRGQVVDFAAPQAFRVRSQDETHPFVLAQVMDTSNIPGGTRPGATAPGFDQNLGDEEFVIMLPPAQFLEQYIFFTDPSFATTNLVLTRLNNGEGFADVTVDCLGTISGWQPVGSDGRYEVATADLIRADIGVNGCTNGHHTATSTGPFGLVVWGLDSYSSYAYPAGGNANALSDIVIPPG